MRLDILRLLFKGLYIVPGIFGEREWSSINEDIYQERTVPSLLLIAGYVQISSIISIYILCEIEL